MAPDLSKLDPLIIQIDARCAGHRISTAELIEVTAAAISVQTAPSPGRGAAQSRKKIAETELNISLGVLPDFR